MSLSNTQKQLASGMIFPSGEANFYDFYQDHSYHGGSGINIKYVRTSGELLYTKSPNNSGIAERSGIFLYNSLISEFSSSSGKINLDDFALYAPYIHYYPSDINAPNTKNIKQNKPFYIPFISSFKVSTAFDPYRRIF